MSFLIDVESIESSAMMGVSSPALAIIVRVDCKLCAETINDSLCSVLSAKPMQTWYFQCTDVDEMSESLR